MTPHILILGAGLAGLTTAFRLVSCGFRITIVDKGAISEKLLPPPENLRQNTAEPENLHPTVHSSNAFPFLLHRFQDATWSLLQDLGTISYVRDETPLRFEFFQPARPPIVFRSFPLPSPFHIIPSVLSFRALSVKDRWSLLNTLEKMWEGETELPKKLDTYTTQSWIEALGQSTSAQREVWNPLCRFFLGEPLSQSSAHSFREMMVRCFFSARRNHETFLLPLDEQSLVLAPLQKHLSQKGVQFHSSNEVTQIHYHDEKVSGVQLVNGTIVTADQYVSTLPPHALARCLPERLLTKYGYFCNLLKLSDCPAVIVHLRMGYTTARPRLVLSNNTFHWMVSRPESHIHAGTTIVSCVVTGDRGLLTQPDHVLVQRALAEIPAEIFPQGTQVDQSGLDAQVIRRPHAFLSPQPGISTFRPLQQSPIVNFHLAGSWTDTGFPASRESSIVSGNLCAQTILASYQSKGVDNIQVES